MFRLYAKDLKTLLLAWNTTQELVPEGQELSSLLPKGGTRLARPLQIDAAEEQLMIPYNSAINGGTIYLSPATLRIRPFAKNPRHVA